MTKAFDTEKFTIGSLLGRYERRRVVLPEFQRSYSWEKLQVTTFWDDLERFVDEYYAAPSTATYFLGSIVLIAHEESLLLLDGQQRMATATIALAAMRDVARTLGSGGSNLGNDLARDIQRELILKESTPPSYALTLGELDEPFFKSGIKADPPAFPTSRLRSHNLIRSAYELSVDRVRIIVHARGIDAAVARIQLFQDALSKGMMLVGILVKSEDDAYTIFETLNDRGLRLSVPDLVLNLLMRRAADAEERKHVRQHWNEMLRKLGTKDVSRFLRHLWVSRYGDLKSEGLFAAIKRQLEQASLSSVAFAEQCADECEDYVALLDLNVPLPNKSGHRDLAGIVKYLQVASAPPLLLAGYRALSPHDFEKLLRIIAITHVRYIVITNQNPLDFESRMYSAARAIRELQAGGAPSGAMLSAARDKLKELAVTDANVLDAGAGVSLERAEALWMMTAVANELQSETKEVGMDKANLEHVFPQNPAAGAWPNAASLEPLLWSPGNLTILGERLNRQAQNKSFAEKATQYYARSEIELTKELLAQTEWSEAVVADRARVLAARFNAVWPALN